MGTLLPLQVGFSMVATCCILKAPPRWAGDTAFAATLAVFLLWATVAAAADAAPQKRIFYGDLHTHSNLSLDAFLFQTFAKVERGPETACTFARACARVDFYGQSDHAEMLHGDAWKRSQEAVKACNAAAAAAAPPGGEPDLVAFHGFEWTSSAVSAAWGHKNVFFANDTVPDRAIAAYAVGELPVADVRALWTTLQLFGEYDVGLIRGLRAGTHSFPMLDMPRCTRNNNEPCFNVADTPADLFAALRATANDPAKAAAGFDAIVIPHGTAWGMAKVGTDWGIQLNKTHHDPKLQTLIEVYSGHGNSEEYRDYTQNPVYESCFERAAKLTYAICKKRGGGEADCRERAAEAKTNAKVPYPTKPEHWGACGQCPDCWQPAERYEPNSSVQAALALRAFDSDGNPSTRYVFGFIAATDDHFSRPGSVKEFKPWSDWPISLSMEAASASPFSGNGRNSIEAERIASFLYPGGLVAVHAEARSREAIWAALKRREVYGTSGPRIELWFDAIIAGRTLPMGSHVTLATNPTFRVEAIGGPEELPGCPAASIARWGEDIIRDVCLGECFHPGNRRTGIDRIEVIKITPQNRPGEPIAALIHDPWRTYINPDRDAAGNPSPRLVVEFSDPEFATNGRDALYYVRVLQAPTPAVNGSPLSPGGTEIVLCDAHPDQSCLSMTQERAWSSPIYVDYGASP